MISALRWQQAFLFWNHQTPRAPKGEHLNLRSISRAKGVDVAFQNNSNQEILTIFAAWPWNPVVFCHFLVNQSPFCTTQMSIPSQDAAGSLRRWMATCMAATRGELPAKQNQQLGCGRRYGPPWMGLERLNSWFLTLRTIGFRFMVEIHSSMGLWTNFGCPTL